MAKGENSAVEDDEPTAECVTRMLSTRQFFQRLPVSAAQVCEHTALYQGSQCMGYINSTSWLGRRDG